MIASLAVLSTALLTAGAGMEPSPWPSVEELPRLDDLPDPFTFRDGGRVATPEDWRRRRTEIESMLSHYEYGHMPPPVPSINVEKQSVKAMWDGEAELREADLLMGPDHKLRMHVGYYLPLGKQGPFPVLLALEPVWKEALWPVAQRAAECGIIFAGYDRHGLDEDNADRSDGAHPLYPDYDWATLAVWAWGAMRTLDYLVTREAVDAEAVALTGHSRAGKTALLAGALDERFALVAPHCSGSGGCGSHRIEGKNCETLDAITNPKRFHYWFHPRLRDFAGKEDRLPFDQHFLKALVAPRALLSMAAAEDHWANPLGTQQMWRATQPVYDFLAVPEKNALFVRPGGHDWTEQDWQVLLDYCGHFLRGKPLPDNGSRLPFPNAKTPHQWTAPGTQQ